MVHPEATEFTIVAISESSTFDINEPSTHFYRVEHSSSKVVEAEVIRFKLEGAFSALNVR
jgi:hypothetical protein